MENTLFVLVPDAAAWLFAALRDLSQISIGDICIRMAVKQQDKTAVGLQARSRKPSTERMNLSTRELGAV